MVLREIFGFFDLAFVTNKSMSMGVSPGRMRESGDPGGFKGLYEKRNADVVSKGRQHESALENIR